MTAELNDHYKNKQNICITIVNSHFDSIGRIKKHINVSQWAELKI